VETLEEMNFSSGFLANPTKMLLEVCGLISGALMI